MNVDSYRYKVSLRVFHPTRRAEEIATNVGLKGHILQSVGEPRKAPKGEKLNGIYDRTYVTFNLEETHKEGVVELLRKTLEVTLVGKTPYLSELVETGGKVEFFVGMFGDENIGLEIDAGLISDLASARIAVSLDIYWTASEAR